jgi:large subunit ribosomal protein L10
LTEQRQILQEKALEVDEIEKTIQQYKVIALASLHKVRAPQLQELRKKLHPNAHLKVIKNTIFKRVISRSKDKKNLDKLEDHVIGSTIYLFTNLNPYKLVLLLEKSKVRTTAKAGDVAAVDVIVPAGNTGQPPGPIISQLGAVGLKTRIESGSVWINKDTLVAKKGEIISARLAPILSKLGLKPVEAGLVLKTVYDDGDIIIEDQLKLDIEDTKRTIEDAYRYAFYLSINIAYTNSETISFLLQKAHHDAFRLSVNGEIPTKETIVDILRKAHMETVSLKTRLDTIKSNPQKD